MWWLPLDGKNGTKFFAFLLQDMWYQKKKVKKFNLVPNPTVVKRLYVALNYVINSSPQTGCDFCITLNLTESVKKCKCETSGP